MTGFKVVKCECVENSEWRLVYLLIDDKGRGMYVNCSSGIPKGFIK
jgi:hypothetical protein